MFSVELTKKMIGIDSTDPGAFEAKAAEEIIRTARKRLPSTARIERVEVMPGRPILRLVLPGTDPSLPDFAFICHMDTVPFGEGWHSDPLEAKERDGKIYGRGACDMKSGLAASLSAFFTFAENEKTDRTLSWIGTCDEEDIMRGSERASELGWVTKKTWLMDCEPTDGKIETAHKGRYWFRYTIHGRAAHASEPWTGADAIAGMAYAVAKVRAEIAALPEDEFLGETTVTFGTISGGTQPYQVPADCTVTVDIRAVPGVGIERLKEILKTGASYAAKRIPGISCEVEVTGVRESVPHYPESPLLKALSESVLEETGANAEVTAFPGYTDTAVIAAKTGNANTLSYGPGSLDMAHKPDEYVEIADIVRCERVYLKLLRRLGRRNEQGTLR